MQETNISKMSLTELKALAYDHISQLERTQKNLTIINNEIQKRMEENTTPPVEEPKQEEKVEETPAQ
jgi:hypothetical protein